MIIVLRLGHRISRDKRITTHVALVARAFGADKIIIETKDVKIEENIRSIVRKFGGNFEIQTGIKAKNFIRKWEGKIVHLTMYGEQIDKSIKKIKKNVDLLVIVGAEKVPPWIYELSDYNISIGNQPHSEVAALAIFLDKYYNGSWSQKNFNGKIQIIPSSKEKKVLDKSIN